MCACVHVHVHVHVHVLVHVHEMCMYRGHTRHSARVGRRYTVLTHTWRLARVPVGTPTAMFRAWNSKTTTTTHGA